MVFMKMFCCGVRRFFYDCCYLNKCIRIYEYVELKCCKNSINMCIVKEL